MDFRGGPTVDKTDEGIWKKLELDWKVTERSTAEPDKKQILWETEEDGGEKIIEILKGNKNINLRMIFMKLALN